MVQWASEVILNSLMSLSESLSLINDDFQSETFSKLETARCVKQCVESMDIV